ncbi:MAG TPA: adenylate/guanylate cyclase domain-containing protein, partial [Myxococcota bacterium]
MSWLVGGVVGVQSPAPVVARICNELNAAGVQIDRAQALVRTLHPHVAGRVFLWQRGHAQGADHVDVGEVSYAAMHAPDMADFAMVDVFKTGQPVHLPVHASSPHGDVRALAAVQGSEGGYTDFFGGPLVFISEQVHGISFATQKSGGFSAGDVDALTRILAPLARIAEIFALLRTATNLLNTYVGHDAGERILAGQIQRGDTQSMRAVIWFSDLRGFTSMSSALPPATIIATLNDVFDCQVPAIELRGGEVLKYMGDGMLAIFPIVDDSDDAVRARCDEAIAAAQEAFASLEVLNGRRSGKGEASVRFGIALHIGDVAYGNIGGANRLDFTCIGEAVNLSARLEALASKVGRPVILSD